VEGRDYGQIAAVTCKKAPAERAGAWVTWWLRPQRTAGWKSSLRIGLIRNSFAISVALAIQ